MDFTALTDRQRSFLRHRCLGKTVRQTAQDMEMPYSAAQRMMTAIIETLGLESVFARDSQIVKICVNLAHAQGYALGRAAVLDEIEQRLVRKQCAR